MKIENLTEEQRLDLEILMRAVEISDFLSSGEAELKINPLDSDELIGSIIKRALSLADGAVINIVDCPLHRKLSILSKGCLLYTSPSPRDQRGSRMPSSA